MRAKTKNKKPRLPVKPEKRSAAQMPDADMPQESGVLQALSKYLPFLKRRSARSRIDRDTIVKKRAKAAKHKARIRAKHYRERVHHPVVRLLQSAAQSIVPEQKPFAPVTALMKTELSLPISKKQEVKPAVAPDVIDDFSERLFTDMPQAKKSASNGPLSYGPIVKKKEEQQAPIVQESIGGGIGGFFRSLFAFPGVHVQSMTIPVSAPATAESISTQQKAKKTVTDLDALLQEAAPASPTVPEKKQKSAAPVQPELPSADLMQAPAKSAGPATKAAIAETKTPAPKEKPVAPALPKLSDIPKKPEPAKDVAKGTASAAEVTFKPRPVHHVGAFAEFLGSLKYFGLGKEQQGIVQNLSTMLNAGLPLIDSLKTLELETRIRPIKKLLSRILELVENGSPLWRALEDQHFFSPHAIALIRIGEEAGNLSENMEYLAIQQEKDAALRGKVKMAMIYPSIVMTLMFVIVIGLGMFVLPNLVSVLFSLNVKLPLATRMVIAFTNFFTTYGKVAVPASIAGIVCISILCKFTRLKTVAQWIMFRIPGIGRLVREATIGRFGVILGGLLQAGVPLVDALRSLAEVTPVVAYKHFYERMLDHITVGDSFSKSFLSLRGSEKLLPVSVQQLIVTGEKSGSLAKILLKVADIYEKKANATAEKLPVILEPMILLFIGALVGTIAFAIIVPIYSIVGNVANQ